MSPAKKTTRKRIVARQDRSGRLRFRAVSLSGEKNQLFVYEDSKGRPHFTRTCLKIWLLTWNCGNTYPSDDHLNKLIVDRLCSCPDADRPDLIVIGAQEHKRRTPIHIRIPALLAGKPVNYRFLGECVVNGESGGHVLKLGLDRFNCQALGVLVGNDIQDTRILTSITATRRRGKGGIGLAVDIKKDESVFKLVFISAHLGSYNVPRDQREEDSWRIMSEIVLKRRNLIDGLDPQNAFADAVFLMGDLNFRLRQFEVGFGLLTHKTSRADICSYIKERKYPDLLKHDELRVSSLVTGMNKVRFKFPDPDFPPTYKIKVGNANPAESTGRALKTYFGKKKGERQWEYVKPKSKKRTGIDIGWLDRIGWAESWSNWGAVLSQEGPAEITVKEYSAVHEVIMSDHAPVLMKAEVVLYR